LLRLLTNHSSPAPDKSLLASSSAISGRTLTGFRPVRSSERPVIILRWIWV